MAVPRTAVPALFRFKSLVSESSSAAGSVEAGFCRQRLLLGVDATVGIVFELDRRELAQGAVESDGVRLPDPVSGGEVELVGAVPGSFVQHAASR